MKKLIDLIPDNRRKSSIDYPGNDTSVDLVSTLEDGLDDDIDDDLD